MPNIIQIITIIIALLSLITAYLSFRDKKSDKIDKELADRIKATVLSDAVTVKAEALANSVNQKAQILSDAFNLKSIEIKELQKQVIDIALDQNTMQEQIRTIIKNEDKVADKLDKILEIAHNDRRNDDNDSN